MIGGSAVRFCFPIAYIMSFIKEVRRNTFEWKIEKFERNIWHRTGNLNIDGYSVELFADRGKCRCHDTYNLCHFRLWADDVSFLPVAYTFSILDYEGRAFVTSVGKILKHDGDEKRILMLTHLFYLKAYNLIGSGTLSVRFSLDRETDAEEGSNPFTEKALNVADNATNTTHLVTKDSGTNTVLDGEFIKLLETLSNDFYTFYEDKTDTDCVLKVNGAQFSAHRAILSARSSVFSAMFHHDTSENRSGEVNIPDINATVLSDILYYIYSGKIKGLTVDIAASMYVAADKYDLPQLRRECLEFLKLNLTLENFCEATLLAHTYGEMELEESVVGFIKDNFDEILESNIWQQFLKDKPMLTSKLLISVLKMSNKREVRDSN